MKLPRFLRRWIAKRPKSKPPESPQNEPVSREAVAQDAQVSNRALALILSPLGVLLLSAVRLIIVADYNTTTAVTIASSSGYVNALLGSIIPLVPVFAPYIALLLLLFRQYLLSIIAFIITAFITPAPIRLSDMLPLAKANLHLLFGNYPFASHIAARQIAAFIVLALIIAAFWVYHRSLGEAVGIVLVMAIAAALLLARPSENPSAPHTLLLAGMGEHRLLAWTGTEWLLIFCIALLVLFLILTYYQTFPKVLSVFIALVATIAFLPYVFNIYPFPHSSSYYAKVMHELWLPAERIALKSGLVYSGYVLSNSDGWFTVLQINKTITYLRADEVIQRSACQPATNPKPPPYPPLVSLLYRKPSPTSECPATITSIRSKGQSLRTIASTVHRCPFTIISVTNVYEHEKMSAALRAYESVHNWYAPTPVGQRFWYYPHVRSNHFTCPHSRITW
jgi:hypothetical protein